MLRVSQFEDFSLIFMQKRQKPALPARFDCLSEVFLYFVGLP